MTKKSFIKTIGSKGLLSDYNTEGKKLQTELTAGDNVSIANNVISSNQVFVATYEATKYAEVKAAYDAGKTCTVFRNGRYYYMTWFNSDYIQFSASNENDRLYQVSVSSGNKWSAYSIQLQRKLTFDTTPTAGSNNPVTSDGIKTALDTKQETLTAGDNITIANNVISSNQVFVATYRTTTYQEIKDAYDAGKVCICRDGNNLLFLSIINDNYALFTLTNGWADKMYVKTCYSSDNTWVNGEYTYQRKLTFDTTPTAGSTNPVTSDGIKTALDSRVPAPTSTTGTQVLKCINGVVQWVADNAGSFATKEYVDSMLGNVEQLLSEL